MKLSVRSLSYTGLAVALTIFLVAGYLAQESRNGLRETIQARSQTYSVVSVLRAVGSFIGDIEDGQRAFAITGDESVLISSKRAMERIGPILDTLSAKVADDTNQADHARELCSLVNHRIDLAKELIRVRKEKGPDEALRLVKSGISLDVLNQIESLLAVMVSYEDGKWEERSNRVFAEFERTSVIFNISLILALLVIGLSSFYLLRENRLRAGAENSLRDLNEQLEQRVSDRTAELRNANESLHLSEEKYRATLSSIGDAVIAADTNENITFMNEVAEQLTGWRLEEVHGETLSKVFRVVHEGTRQPIESPVEKVLKSGRVAGLANHSILITRDHREIPIDDSGAPIRNATGEIAGVVLVFRDVTEPRKAQEALRLSEERYSTTLRSIGDAVIATDALGKITFMNSVAEEVTGWSLAEAQGQDISRVFQIINEQSRQIVESPVEKVLQLGKVVGLANHTILITKDGREIPVNDSGSPIRRSDGSIAGAVLVFRDVSEERRAHAIVQRQADLINLSPDAMFVRGMDGTISFWSRGAERLYQWSEDDAVGKRTHDILHTRFPIPLEAIQAQLQRTGRWQGELVHQRKDGTELVVESRWLLQRDQIGTPEEIFESNVDISRRKRSEEELRESEQRYRSLFENMLDGYAYCEMLFDQGGAPNDFIYLDVNRSFERLTGLKDVVGRKVTEVIPGIREDNPELFEIYGRVAMTGKPQKFEVDLKPLGLVLSVSVYGSHTGRFVAVFDNITERKKAEAEISKLNQSLELRVQERTEELQTTIKELESFSYSVSHDLRAPLRAINSYASMTLESNGRQLDDAGKRYLQNAIQNSRMMGQLVDELLAFSRLGRQELQFSAVDLGKIVRNVIEELRAGEPPSRQIEFTVAGLPDVRGNAPLLQQTFMNLLSNALKYSRQRPKTCIQIGTCKEGEETVFFVRDNGVGFDMHYADKLFGVFQRLHAQEGYEGTGIGLALVKRIVERHGGRVWAESEPEKGATFFFTLPS